LTQLDHELVTLLFEALAAPVGRKVTSNNPGKLRQRLYVVRKLDPSFLPLSFVISPHDPENELWIIHSPKETSDAPSQD